MSDWKPYDSDKEIKITKDYIVIRPTDKRSVTPLFCPCCHFPMKVVDDFISWREFECCSSCELAFARTNKERWLAGWRPDSENAFWVEYMENRQQLFKPTFNFA